MLFLYFLPMITVFLLLFYFIRSHQFKIINGAVLILAVGAFIPIANIAICLMCFVIWAIESEWFNRPFKGL